MPHRARILKDKQHEAYVNRSQVLGVGPPCFSVLKAYNRLLALEQTESTWRSHVSSRMIWTPNSLTDWIDSSYWLLTTSGSRETWLFEKQMVRSLVFFVSSPMFSLVLTPHVFFSDVQVVSLSGTQGLVAISYQSSRKVYAAFFCCVLSWVPPPSCICHVQRKSQAKIWHSKLG